MRNLLIIFMAIMPTIICAQVHRLGRHLSATTLLHTATTSGVSVQPSLSAPQVVDSVLTPVIPFTPMAVSMHGYTKQLRDANETFILRNETCRYHISRVLLLIVYKSADGQTISKREELVDCDIAPGATQEVKIKSFDNEKQYYYYTTPPKRVVGIPYTIQYNVLRYDVVVE